MKNILYSVLLTTESKRFILDSLKDLFESEFQKMDTTRLVGLICEINFVISTRERVFLSTGSWLLVLRALRAKMLKYGTSTVLRFQYASIGYYICQHIEDVEGDLAYTYKVFRFFMPPRL